MQSLTIIGNLTRDPDSRTTQTGKQVCTFTVAVNRRNDRETSDFFRVSAWGELANICKQYLAKGKKVCIVGQISVSTYTANNGETRASMDVYAEHVEFLSPAGSPAQNAANAPQNENKPAYTRVENEQLPWEQ